jgi:hypothetical protein
MIGLSTQLIGTAGVVFLASSLLPGSFGSSPSGTLPVVAPVEVSSKGDRLAPPAPVRERSTVTSVELIGVNQAVVILRDQNGRILFQSNPLTNTTVVARDAELPVITLKQEEKSPVVQQEPSPQREGEQAPAATGRKVKPVGCEGAVSPLAKGHGGTPSLCLASLDSGSART